jgi:membrane protein YqaA with SNARE-associated domain
MVTSALPSAPAQRRTVSPRARFLVALLELGLIAGLLLVWVLSETVRSSKSLWVLFFYNFPSQFLISVVPHEPVFLYFSKYFSPALVTLVAISGTLLTEALNYTCFGAFTETSVFEKARKNRIVGRLTNLFNRAPFTALWIAGVTPVPFYPFRFLVVLARYPLSMYLLAVFLSRTPRFYLLALFGNAVRIPDGLLIALFGFVVVLLNVPLLRGVLRRRSDAGRLVARLAARQGP